MNLVVQPLRKEPMMFTQSIKPAWAICAVVLLGSIGIARAQDSTSPTVPPAASPPAPAPSAPGQAASFTDAELEQYVKAALSVQKLQQDTAIPETDKQTKMAAAVQGAGLTPEKFNQIATASQADTALQQRIQAVAT